jgi:hypothetical protein
VEVEEEEEEGEGDDNFYGKIETEKKYIKKST